MTAIDQLDPWTVDEGSARARTLFVDRFGTDPDGVWSAPGRVNLIGEHTDYNDGLCLPIALPHRTYAAVRVRDDSRIRLVSAQEAGDPREVDLADVGPGTVDGWPAYVAGVAWALRQARHQVGGFDVAIDSCVPYGAGLSSSAALESSVAIALDTLHDLGLGADDAGRSTLTALCVRAENEVAGAPTGGMDQAAALRSRAGHALLLDCLDGAVRHVPFDLAAEGLALLVVDTRAEHALVDGQYAARRASCEAAADRLGLPSLRALADDERGWGWALDALAGSPDADVEVPRVRHVVTEIGRVRDLVALLDGGRVREVGPLLDASHESLRDDYTVSCRELDLAVATAREAGALGARMTGGGFGGSAIALVEQVDVERVTVAVAEAFAAAGLRAPGFLVATAEAAAS